MNDFFRVLLIDDDAGAGAAVQHGLQPELQYVHVEHVQTQKQFERALDTRYDLAVVTYGSDWNDGVSVCATLKARDADLSVILLLRAEQEAIVAEAVRAGLDAYIIKSGNYLARLSASIGLVFERRVQRRAAREIETQLHELFNRVPVGLYRITPDGTILQANPALMQISGCPDKQTMLASNAMDFFVSRDNFEKWNHRVESQDSVHDYEGPARRLDGQVVWVRNNVRVVRNADGGVLYYEGSIEDITLRKQMEDALRESRSFLEQTQEVGEIGSWVFGLGDDRSLRWSRQSYLIFGVAEGTPIDVDTFFRAVHPDDHDAIRRAVEHAIATYSPYSVEHRIVLPDGTQRWVSEQAEVIFDSAGRPARLIGVVQDVTERHRREEAMLREKALTEQTLNSVPGIFYLLDEAGRFLRWNQNFETVTGYSAAEIADLHPMDLVPGDQRDLAARHLNDTFRAGARDVDAVLFCKDGRRIPYHFITRRIELDGKPCIVGTGLDISERIRADQEIRLLQTITLAMSEETSDLKSALGIVLRKICDATGWTVGEAWLPSADNTYLHYSGASYVADVELEHFVSRNHEFRYAPGEAMLGMVWQSKQPLWVADVGYNRGTPRAHLVRAAGLKAGMCIPVMAGDAVAAVLSFFVRDSKAEDQRLMSIVSGAAAQLGLVIQRKRAEARVHFLAHFDGLTGLPNRSLLTDRLARTIIEAGRHRRQVGVVFLDLDRFKKINDSLGHEVGDQLIKSVGERLTGAVRKGDTVARLSGDEFAVILADMSHADDAARVARKMLDTFTQPFHVCGNEIHIAASLGITLYPSDDKDVAGLLRNADVAMYRAKEAGGNSYQFYSADMSARAAENLALENELRHAIARDELVLHYQPLVDARGGHVVAVEALLRWRHPKHGMISPMQFIPLAEESGLIIPIGEWVLRSACRQCQVWRQGGYPGLRVAVNLSAHQFQRQGFDTAVMTVLHDAGLDPHALELELTESVIMQSSQETMQAMQRLADHGVNFSIDDFGTGYSNLSYLKKFPVEILKIDRSFVKDIPTDADDAAIADAIITMAHSLGMSVVAEGVENERQSAFLRAHRCDIMQGYYFSRPVPADDISNLLHHYRLPPSRKLA